MTEGVYFFMIGVIFPCVKLCEEIRKEMEDQKLPPGVYVLKWGS